MVVVFITLAVVVRVDSAQVQVTLLAQEQITQLLLVQAGLVIQVEPILFLTPLHLLVADMVLAAQTITELMEALAVVVKEAVLLLDQVAQEIHQFKLHLKAMMVAMEVM